VPNYKTWQNEVLACLFRILLVILILESILEEQGLI